MLASTTGQLVTIAIAVVTETSGPIAATVTRGLEYRKRATRISKPPPSLDWSDALERSYVTVPSRTVWVGLSRLLASAEANSSNADYPTRPRSDARCC